MSALNKITVLTSGKEHLLTFQLGVSLRDILIGHGINVRSACGGNAVCGQCQVRVDESADIPFTSGERARLSAQQLSEGVRLSCQLKPEIDLHVSIELPTAQMAWRTLREDEFGTGASLFMPRLSGLRYGVAIDLGTTHIRLTLWDLFTVRRIAGEACLNPQGSYGADVLTRLMEAARSIETAREIGELVERAIGECLVTIAAEAKLDLYDVGEVLIVGNTAMLSLLAGINSSLLLQPENWTMRIDCQPQDTTFLRKSWQLGDDTHIFFVTTPGGFVGSDLLAGVISTRLTERPAGSLLIDFGTNSEMVLWDGHKLHVTSTAGGPAFEGCGISCGMPGEVGAIYRVEQDGADEFKIHVLGDVKPFGLCGSGLVDAVAWLLRNGRIDQVGRFHDRQSAGFELYAGTRPIILKRSDIDVLQRAKAAIGAGVCWLCQQAGISPSELQQVYTCGAFGRLLNIDSAMEIGLLPPVPREAVVLEGNTALAGCEALLLSPTGQYDLDSILAMCNIYNLGEVVGFETLFVENLYLKTMPK